MNTSYEKIAAAIEFVERHANQQPELEEIAAAVFTSPFHFQRLFTDWAGISPKKFLQHLTLEHAKELLSAKQQTLFDAAYETGLSGTGRLHDLFVNMEGMTPGEYKNGGASLTIQFTVGECLFGKYLAASTGKGICNLSFFEGNDQTAINQLKLSWPNAILSTGIDQHLQKVIDFFSRDALNPVAIKLHLKGTAFQLKVWQALLRIPEGDIASYGNIARHLNQHNASRAVGTAIGSNPVGYIIPCHRVIKNIGETGGYRWGPIRKKTILLWEATQQEKLYAKV